MQLKTIHWIYKVGPFKKGKEVIMGILWSILYFHEKRVGKYNFSFELTDNLQV